MIKTQLSLPEIQTQLRKLDVSQAAVLSSYAGFADDSQWPGQPRQTFSLVLQPADVAYLQDCMEQLYRTIRKDLVVQPPADSIPFDFIRIDGYYDVESKKLQILEINSHDAGMHEIGEWLDAQTASALKITVGDKLNDVIANNQHAWQVAHLGEFNRALFFSRPGIPRWLYYEAIQRRYPNLVAISDYEAVTFKPTGVVLDGLEYKAVITKASGGRPKPIRLLDDAGQVSLVQSRINGYIGDKKYLESLPFDFVAKAVPIDPAKHKEYLEQQAELVLKKSISSGSRGVIMGRGLTADAWAKALQTVYLEHAAWTMQHYAKPGNGTVIGHGQANQTCRTQLGIFILPSTADPSQCSIDIVVKGYVGTDEAVMFDPAGYKPDIWFGNVIVTAHKS